MDSHHPQPSHYHHGWDHCFKHSFVSARRFASPAGPRSCQARPSLLGSRVQPQQKPRQAMQTVLTLHTKPTHAFQCAVLKLHWCWEIGCSVANAACDLGTPSNMSNCSDNPNARGLHKPSSLSRKINMVVRPCVWEGMGVWVGGCG